MTELSPGNSALRAAAVSAAGGLDAALARVRGPVLVLSTRVGRGMVSLGDAVVERLAGTADVQHRVIEDFLPGAAVGEDLRRYRLISNRFPLLLHLPYRFPPIYLRKLLRERYVRRTDLGALERELERWRVRTVIAISHRPTFWTAGLREHRRLPVELIGLLGEYGSSLGWRYLPWSQVGELWTPVPASALRYRVPAHVAVTPIELPARAEFGSLRGRPGRRQEVLVVCGLWGQGRIDRVVGALLRRCSGLRVHAVCGDNERMRRRVERVHGGGRLVCHGVVESLAPLMAQCASVVTKPGIATLVEAHAAGRKLFLLRGMPVAEDNNARHALRYFGAEWFRPQRFSRWLVEAPDVA